MLGRDGRCSLAGIKELDSWEDGRPHYSVKKDEIKEERVNPGLQNQYKQVVKLGVT